MRRSPQLSDRESAAIGAFFQPCLEAGLQPVELGHVGGIKPEPRRPQCRRGNGVAAAQNLLAHGKPEARRFYDYLQGESAAAVFRRARFEVLP